MMDTSFLTKQVAKKITLLRHLSKQQLYEISITWETDSGEAHESLHYLPEIFLYPYAVRKDRASQSTKVSEISLFSDTSLDLEYTPNPNSINPRTPNLSQPIHHQQPSSQKKFSSQNHPACPKEVQREKKSTLDYDQFKKKLGVQEQISRRNRQVLTLKEVREGRKKRRV